ncbi:MAG: sulfatase-like hydrolase/transferase [Acidobacteriota bacterium]
MITLDTVRSDHLGCYDYAKAKTPNLDGFAKEGIIFEHAVCPSPSTVPSHATIMTGLYPPGHGVRVTGRHYLPDNATTLAEILSAKGFRTGAVISGFPLTRRFGINQGFDFYEDSFYDNTPGRVSIIERSAKESIGIALKWLSQNKDSRFFLWLHLFDPHSDYTPPAPFDREFHDAPYDGEIAYMDSQLGPFFDKLKEWDLFDRSLIIIAGDHGEGLGDHGEMEHQYLIYNSTVMVPLLLRAGNVREAKKIPELVGLVDIFPTVLDMLGIKEELVVDGESLRNIIEAPPGRTGERLYYIESLSGEISLGWSPLYSTMTGNWKFIEAPEPELYRIMDDPSELQNLALKEPEMLECSRKELAQTMAELLQREEKSGVKMDEETMRDLASLGYISAGSFKKKDGGSLKDPKKYIHLEKEIVALYKLFLTNQKDKIFPYVETILKADSENRLALLYAGTAHYEKRQYPQALFYLDRLYQYYQDEIGNEMLIRIYIEQRNLDRAIEVSESSVEFFPDKPQFHTLKGMLMAENKRYGDAIESFKKSLSIDHSNPEVYYYIARCYAITGDEDSSMEAIRDSLMKGLGQPGIYLADPVFRNMKRFHEIERLVDQRKKS